MQSLRFYCVRQQRLSSIHETAATTSQYAWEACTGCASRQITQPARQSPQPKKELGVGEMLGWLQAEMAARGIAGRIVYERVHERTERACLGDQEFVYQFVRIPIFLEAGQDNYPSPLVFLQEAWNCQVPTPEKQLFLYPGEVPDGVV